MSEDVINKRIEAKVQAVLHSLGYETVRLGGKMHLVNTTQKTCNLVSLLHQLLQEADELIEDLKPLRDPSWVNDPDAVINLNRIRDRITAWDAPLELRIEEPPKKPRKRRS